MAMQILLAALGAIAVTAVIYFVSYRRRDEGAGAVTGSTQLNWCSDVNTALQKARAENKLVLVDVYAGWCGWCKKLFSDTLTDPKVISFLDGKFVAVKLDAEDKGEGQAFARKQAVRGYPTIIVLDCDGKFLGSFTGYRSARDFPAAVKDACAGKL